jgi:hypothetical protein
MAALTNDSGSPPRATAISGVEIGVAVSVVGLVSSVGVSVALSAASDASGETTEVSTDESVVVGGVVGSGTAAREQAARNLLPATAPSWMANQRRKSLRLWVVIENPPGIPSPSLHDRNRHDMQLI